MYPSWKPVATQGALLSEKRLSAELDTAREWDPVTCTWQEKNGEAIRREGKSPLVHCAQWRLMA